MQADLKDFYKLQYEWKRIPYNGGKIASDKSHPLYPIELEISHSTYIIHDIVREVLEGKEYLDREKIGKCIQAYEKIGSELDKFPKDKDVMDYQFFVNCTLDVLNKALNLRRST